MPMIQSLMRHICAIFYAFIMPYTFLYLFALIFAFLVAFDLSSQFWLHPCRIHSIISLVLGRLGSDHALTHHILYFLYIYSCTWQYTRRETSTPFVALRLDCEYTPEYYPSYCASFRPRASPSSCRFAHIFITGRVYTILWRIPHISWRITSPTHQKASIGPLTTPRTFSDTDCGVVVWFLTI